MKLIIIILLILSMIILVGCNSEYEDCFDDCAHVDCNYKQSIRPTYNSNIKCNDVETIKEHCYKECK